MLDPPLCIRRSNFKEYLCHDFKAFRQVLNEPAPIPAHRHLNDLRGAPGARNHYAVSGSRGPDSTLIGYFSRTDHLNRDILECRTYANLYAGSGTSRRAAERLDAPS